MSSSFFLKKKPQVRKTKVKTTPKGSKRKGAPLPKPPNAARKRKVDEEEIESDEEDGIEGIDPSATAPDLVFSADEGEEETPQDKRLRLAKIYLEEIQKQEAERAEDKKVHDQVSHRLQSEYLDSVGKLRRSIASNITGYYRENVITLKNKKQNVPICTIALSSDGKYLFSGAKTQYVIKWNVEQQKVEGFIDVQPHRAEAANGKKRRSHVNAMCLSSDMKFLALGDRGNHIQIWCPTELKHLKTLTGHRAPVSAVVFRKDTHELYSAAEDRSVKVWSLDEMAYVESLFGHRSSITAIDALSRERAITSGGNDCTLRIWKITEESQLIYNGHQGSVESVKFVNDENFISCGDDGSICLWSALKKKPIFTLPTIHGRQANGEANWISALACIPNTDLIATGSCDGFVRIWHLDNGRELRKILEIPLMGFVNCLAFNSAGTRLYAAVGQEHHKGRWQRIKEAKNGINIFHLKIAEASEGGM